MGGRGGRKAAEVVAAAGEVGGGGWRLAQWERRFPNWSSSSSSRSWRRTTLLFLLLLHAQSSALMGLLRLKSPYLYFAKPAPCWLGAAAHYYHPFGRV